MNIPALEQLRTILARWQRTCAMRFASRDQPAEAVPPRLPIERMAFGAEWSKVTMIMADALRSARLVGELQRSSALQLDAASYALEILKFDLATMMARETHTGKSTNVVHMPRPLRIERRRAGLAA